MEIKHIRNAEKVLMRQLLNEMFAKTDLSVDQFDTAIAELNKQEEDDSHIIEMEKLLKDPKDAEKAVACALRWKDAMGAQKSAFLKTLKEAGKI